MRHAPDHDVAHGPEVFTKHYAEVKFNQKFIALLS